MFADAFSLKKAPPVDVHFESMGFETSDMIINLSSVITLRIILLTLAIISVLFLWYASSDNLMSVYLSSFKSESGLFKRVSLFLDWFFLFIAICCTINVYQEKEVAAAKD